MVRAAAAAVDTTAIIVIIRVPANTVTETAVDRGE